MNKPRSLKRYLFSSFILLILLIVVFFEGMALFIRNHTAKDAWSKNAALTEASASLIMNYLQEPVKLLEGMELFLSGPSLLSYDGIQRVLDDWLGRYPYFESIIMADRRGIVRYTAPYDQDQLGTDISRSEFFISDGAAGRIRWSPAFISPRNGKPAMTISLAAGGWIIAGFLNLEEMADLLRSIPLPPNTRIVLADRKGMLIFHPDTDRLSQHGVLEEPLLRLKEVRTNTQKAVLLDEGLVWASTSHIPGVDWTVFVVQDAADAMRSADFAGLVMFILLAFMIILLFIISRGLYSNLFISINRLVEVTRAVSAGETSIRINPEGYTEVRSIAENINTMADSMLSRQQEVKKSEARLRTIYNAGYDAILIHDYDGRILSVNQRFLSMYRVKEADLPALNVSDLSVQNEKNLELMTTIWKRVREGQEPLFEWPARRPSDKSEFPVEVGLKKIDWEGREAVISFIRDITMRREMERVLRESESRFRDLANLLPLGIFETDERMVIRYANMQTLKYYGYDTDDLKKGLTVAEMIDPADRDRAAMNIQDLAKGKGSVGNEYNSVRRNGSVFPVRVYTTVIIRDGVFCGLRGVIIDISEQKSAELKLLESQERFRLASEILSDYIFQLRVKEDLGLSLEMASGRLRLEPGQESGFNFRQWINTFYTDDRQMVLSALHDAVKHREMCELECRSYLDEKETIWVSLVARPILEDISGRVVSVIGAVRNIDARKKAADEVRLLNEELEKRVVERTAQLMETNRELEAFSYSASHDLRVPLRTISGFTAMIQNDYGQDMPREEKELFSHINKAVDKMGELIDSLLRLSRITLTELNRDDVDLSRLAVEIRDGLLAYTRGRDVEFTVQEGMNDQVDAALFKIALENLFHNAVKFSQGKSKVRISFSRELKEGRFVYSVSDNGVGFDMQYVDKLFAPFKRLHRENEFEGSGIGLATVKRIIALHGGLIWATGSIGVGAVFSFTVKP